MDRDRKNIPNLRGFLSKNIIISPFKNLSIRKK